MEKYNVYDLFKYQRQGNLENHKKILLQKSTPLHPSSLSFTICQKPCLSHSMGLALEAYTDYLLTCTQCVFQSGGGKGGGEERAIH